MLRVSLCWIIDDSASRLGWGLILMSQTNSIQLTFHIISVEMRNKNSNHFNEESAIFLSFLQMKSCASINPLHISVLISWSNYPKILQDAYWTNWTNWMNMRRFTYRMITPQCIFYTNQSRNELNYSDGTFLMETSCLPRHLDVF